MLAEPILAVIAVAVITAEPTSKPSGEMPGALKAAFARAMSIRTLHAKYTYSRKHPEWESVIIQNREDRIAGDDIYSINRGDDDEVVFGPRGNKMPGFGRIAWTCAPHKQLVSLSLGEVWNYREGDDSAGVTKYRADMFYGPDLRTAGLYLSLRKDSPRVLFGAKLKYAKNDSWAEIPASNGLVTVITTSVRKQGSRTGGRSEYSWTIDPSKNHAILRTTFQDFDATGTPRGPLVACDLEYKKIDGYWIAVKSVKRGSHTLEEIFVHEVTINRPEHPQELTPKIMDIPVGTMIGGPPEEGQGRGLSNLSVWDGGKLRGNFEWQWIKKRFDTRRHDEYERRRPRFGAYPSWWDQDDETFGLTGVSHHPHQWDAYVRRWIYKNSHDREHPIRDRQKIEAAEILNGCKTEGHAIFGRIERQLAELEADLAKPALADAERRDIESRRDRLVEPIITVFCERLKPGLEKLLDEKQRGERDQSESATSEPAEPKQP